MNVLLLNASYEPLQTISVRRAVNLLLSEKVLAVEGTAARLRAVTRTVTVPSVVRLTYYVNVPQPGLRWSRQAVMRRDNWTCIYCGIRPGQKRGNYHLRREDFTLDHLFPRSRGGGNTWGNTACACALCNRRKANRTPHEAGLKLRFEPKRPRTRLLVAQGEMPREWKKYLVLG